MVEKGIVVHGWDVSLNHAAFVELTDGVMTNFWYITSIVSSANKSAEHGTRLPLAKSKERQIKQMARLAYLEKYIGDVLKESKPTYVGLEDYAIRAEQGAHYLGEIGGIARMLCWNGGVNLRLHDPISTKMFVTHDGTAQKDSVERHVESRWGQDFSEYNPPKAKPTKRILDPKQNRTTSEDLADAYGLAMMVWTEIQLRDGRVLLKDLHAKEIQVFNRVTKTYPVNLLDRSWIAREDKTPCCFFCGTSKCCLAGPSDETKVKKIKHVIKKWKGR